MQIVDKSMKSIFENKYFSAIITLIIVLYGALAGPKLPKFVTNVFNNTIFRVLFLTLIVYKGNKDLTLSIAISVGFLITIQIIGEQKFLENFASKNDDDNEEDDHDHDDDDEEEEDEDEEDDDDIDDDDY